MPPPPAPLGPMSSGGLDPASNNQPLHFNAGKMKSVMVHANDNLDCVPTKGKPTHCTYLLLSQMWRIYREHLYFSYYAQQKLLNAKHILLKLV